LEKRKQKPHHGEKINSVLEGSKKKEAPSKKKPRHASAGRVKIGDEKGSGPCHPREENYSKQKREASPERKISVPKQKKNHPGNKPKCKKKEKENNYLQDGNLGVRGVSAVQ